MKIGFDGKRALQNFTGLGNYSRFIIDSLSKNHPENEYFVYAFADGKKTDLKNIILKQPKTSFRVFWRSFGIVNDLKKDKIQLYHGLSNEIPFRIRKAEIKSIVTIHDLIFLRYPEFYPWFDRQLYKLKAKYACKNADRIIATSEQTKRDIITFFSINQDRIEVVYQDCARIFKAESGIPNETIIRRKYNLPEKYILNVGTIEERKNLLLIIKALKKVPKDIHLVVVGKKTDYFKEVENYIQDHSLQKRVQFLDDVKFDDLPSIYRMAKVFVYPSKFEGFGIPIIEALHCEVPVIAATGSCLEEAGGPASLYVNPDDDIKLADYITLVINDETLSTKMTNLGLEYVRKFEGSVLADQINTIYNKVLKNA